MVSSLSDSSQQHTVTFLFSCYFHQCLFCCTSKNLCIRIGRNDLIAALAGKESNHQACNYAKRVTALVNGPSAKSSRAKRARAKPFNDWVVPA